MPEVIPDTYEGYAKTIEDLSKVIADQLAIKNAAQIELAAK